MTNMHAPCQRLEILSAQAEKHGITRQVKKKVNPRYPEIVAASGADRPSEISDRFISKWIWVDRPV